MRSLWAPWRMAYIRRKSRGCFLCEAVRKRQDQQTFLLACGRSCAVILNRFPYANGHLMVFPCRHVADLARLTDAERLDMMNMVILSLQELCRTLQPQGFNIGINLGLCAGAGLAGHIHVHIVPRWAGDTNFMPLLAETRVIPQHLADLWEQLYPRFSAALISHKELGRVRARRTEPGGKAPSPRLATPRKP